MYLLLDNQVQVIRVQLLFLASVVILGHFSNSIRDWDETEKTSRHGIPVAKNGWLSQKKKNHHMCYQDIPNTELNGSQIHTDILHKRKIVIESRGLVTINNKIQGTMVTWSINLSKDSNLDKKMEGW